MYVYVCVLTEGWGVDERRGGWDEEKRRRGKRRGEDMRRVKRRKEGRIGEEERRGCHDRLSVTPCMAMIDRCSIKCGSGSPWTVREFKGFDEQDEK